MAPVRTRSRHGRSRRVSFGRISRSRFGVDTPRRRVMAGWNAMPPDSSPLISVIVVCKDPGLRLRDALASVWAQHISPPPELIVIDGESNEGSRVWLASPSRALSTSVLGTDQGIYTHNN